MTRALKFLALLGVVAGVALSIAEAADASPVTSVFTASPAVARSVTFDATATVCPWGFCSYSWTYFSATTNRLGVHMSDVQRFSYRFPSAGVFTVVLRVGVLCTARGRTSCPATAQTSVSVR